MTNDGRRSSVGAEELLKIFQQTSEQNKNSRTRPVLCGTSGLSVVLKDLQELLLQVLRVIQVLLVLEVSGLYTKVLENLAVHEHMK